MVIADPEGYIVGYGIGPLLFAPLSEGEFML
jgi:hypothetical protein